MEKLIFPLWKSTQQSGDEFRDTLLARREELNALEGVRAGRLLVVDSDVAPCAHRRQDHSKPVPDAILTLWMNRAEEGRAVGDFLAPLVTRFTSYLATESEPLISEKHAAQPGERVHGFCHVVFLQRPPWLSEAQWLEIWHGKHTQIAIDIQSTFGYRQNTLVRSLSYAAPPLHAMIEENFPASAMTSDYAFYDLEEGDDEGVARRGKEMIDSVARFIDFDKIDVIPTSEYTLKAL
ncbi:hypothetical protein BST95_17190 [Halioglobus japonicus]|uniref:EthD domain-containing protein n=1 Tax=Halioglobus japonicus TaxID=930805 RepID=A0AAP8SP58_9GAMM|nr:hypothetical protein [Halioglobus japonicus]AQA19719.1 hypothetical protein BST95_17190 [Halioglobus japonicus]PLW87211.1 hypothetical protein C0029_01025 [Halioglobus japonicus]GHD09641.1 hypothetical protein GCM10007052_08000 [Halioglobus japonicus]